MASKGLKGYFDYLKDKTFINKYPASIITLDELKNKSILEIGSGTFNDMIFLIQNKIISPEDIHMSEPYIPAFCESLDKIEQILGQGYGYKNRQRISFKELPNSEIPDNCVNFFYANNVLHSLNYKSLEDELDLNMLENGNKISQERIIQLQKTGKDKIKEVITEAFRILKPHGVLFGRNLTDYVNAELLNQLELKESKSKTDRFAIWTAKAVLNKELTGINPLDFEYLGKRAGFKTTYTEEEPLDKNKPKINFHFRFEK